MGKLYTMFEIDSYKHFELLRGNEVSSDRRTDRQTDVPTDGQTDGQRRNIMHPMGV